MQLNVLRMAFSLSDCFCDLMLRCVCVEGLRDGLAGHGDVPKLWTQINTEVPEEAD